MYLKRRVEVEYTTPHNLSTIMPFGASRRAILGWSESERLPTGPRVTGFVL